MMLHIGYTLTSWNASLNQINYFSYGYIVMNKQVMMTRKDHNHRAPTAPQGRGTIPARIQSGGQGIRTPPLEKLQFHRVSQA